MLSKILKIALLSFSCYQLSGCASLTKGSHQTFAVVAANDQMPDKTHCTIKNEEGEWSTEPTAGVNIHRDGNTMDIECENATQFGRNQIEPKFDKELLWIDFVWLDLCVISCVIDGVNNAFYEYPSPVTVQMQPK